MGCGCIRILVVDEKTWARFKSRYEVDTSTGCWNWDNKIVNGTNLYGRFMYGGHRYSAHVFSYMIHVKEIELNSKFDTDHLCRNTKCVNPEHLEYVSELENIRRGKGIFNSDPDRCPNGHLYSEVGMDGRSDSTRCSECRRIKIRKQQWKRAGFSEEEILEKENAFTSRKNRKESK